MITSGKMLNYLGEPASAPGIRVVLAELGLDSEATKFEDIADEVSTDLLATDHGVAVFFMTACHLRNQPQITELPAHTAVLVQVMFSARGFNGGPGFSGELPYGLTFSDSRSAVRAHLGEPQWTSPLGIPNDSWTLGERYLTLDFSKDESRIKKVTCGVSWVL